MLALKNTTMSWFKGGRQTQNTSKKRDIATTGSSVIEEEVSNALAVIPVSQNGNTDFSEMERETETPRTRLYTPTSATHSRVTSPTLRDASPLAIESHSSAQPGQLLTRKPYEDTEEYILATSQEDDTDTVNGRVEDRATELLSSAQGKKKGVKLRVAALNMLKMKSSTFLRRPQDGEEQQIVSRGRGSVDLFPTSSNRMTLIRSNTDAGTSTTQPRRPARLTKPPPPDLIRQRRSIVVESIQEDTLDPLESRPNNWGTVANRPPSSQSSHPGVPNRGDDVTSIAADPSAVTTGNLPGGLCPRPSSLKRHWSDGPHSKRDSLTQLGGPSGTPQRAATEGSDRVRPLSFNMLNTYGSMKITEAATLESRVRDLETQVATLHTYITTNVSPSTEVERRPSSKSSNVSHKSSRLTDKSAQTSPALGPPFSEEDMALSKRPDTAQSTHTTSTYMHGHDYEYSVAPESSTNGAPSKTSGSVDWRSVARGGPLTPNHTPYGDSSVSSYVSDETINIRNRAYDHVDNVPGPSTDASKRSTVVSLETITPSRNQNRDYEMDYHRERAMQAPVVTMTEFNGVMKLLRREYRARKKLEAQIQTLQEQMNHVLHRQLLQSDPIYNFGRSPTITGRSQVTTSAASTQRPEHMNGRRTSSEVPTPDLTPPRGRHDLSRASSNLFNGFDSSASATDIDDDRSYYVGGEDDDSEHWQTPAEDTRSLLQLNGHLGPPLPYSTQKRTMSISQITEKASLASARTAAGR